jgi:ankyrin repeat protein
MFRSLCIFLFLLTSFGLAQSELSDLIAWGTPDEVKLWLASNPDVNVIDEVGRLVFLEALPRPEILKLLLEAGADITRVFNGDWTALTVAATHENPESVRLLLEAGARVTSRDLSQAVIWNCTDVLSVLLEYSSPETIEEIKELEENRDNSKIEELNSLDLLMLSAIGSRASYSSGYIHARDGNYVPCPDELRRPEKFVSLLLEAGASVERVERVYNSSLLAEAIFAGNIPLLRVLVQAGADLELKYEDRTPLLLAGVNGDGLDSWEGSKIQVLDEQEWATLRDEHQTELIRALVESDADVNASTELDIPLLQAARRGGLETVRLLLNSGAHLNAQNSVGETPLMVAIKADQEGVAQFLIRQGADISLQDNEGHTALFYDSYDSSTYTLLGGQRLNIDIYELARSGGVQTVETVLNSHEFDLALMDKLGQTLLFYAASHNPNPDVVRVLVEHGSEVNHQDMYGWTALMHAARDNPNPEVIKALVESGADLELKNDRGMTVLMVAAENARPDSVKILIEYGADVNACSTWTISGPCIYTALNYAAIGGDVETLGILLELQDKPIELDWLLVMALDKNPHPEVVKALVNLGANPKLLESSEQ